MFGDGGTACAEAIKAGGQWQWSPRVQRRRTEGKAAGGGRAAM